MKKATTTILAALGLATLTGCAIVSGRAGDSSYVGLAFGEKASSTLAGLNITESVGKDGVTERGVGVDQAGSSGEAKLVETIGKLFVSGLAAYTAAPVAKQTADCATCAPCADVSCTQQ